MAGVCEFPCPTGDVVAPTRGSSLLFPPQLYSIYIYRKTPAFPVFLTTSNRSMAFFSLVVWYTWMGFSLLLDRLLRTSH